MAIYVQSRGIAQDNDYRWLKIGETNLVAQIPSILQRSIATRDGINVRITEMIDSQKPSIILARQDGELLLLVTGLEARSERTDFMGRKIRNSVAWIYEYSLENDKYIRTLAIQALRGELESKIDQAISPGGEYGFEVSWQQLEELPKLENIEDSNNPELINKVAKNSLDLREDLALELQHYSLPYQENRLFVVVTSIKTKSALEQAKVWRGLSNQVEEESWVEIADESVSRAINPARTENQGGQDNFLLQTAIIVIAGIIIFFLLLKILGIIQ